MKLTHSSIVAAIAAATLSLAASGSIVASWSMPTAIPTGTVGTSYNYGAADGGEMVSGTMLSSSHVAAATTYSSPAGNGSSYSLSSNNWAIGDYYQVSLSTSGYGDIHVSWDQTRSGTGPAAWEVFFSIDGGQSWTSNGAYTVVQAGGTGTNTTSWNATTYQAAFTSDQALTAGSDQASLMIRFTCGVTTAAAGTNRIDNITVYGTPAPGAIALLGLAGMINRRRR